MTLFKITIAVVGIWWVIHNSSWNDTATIPANTQLRNVLFVHDTPVTVLSHSTFSPPPAPPHPLNAADTQPRELLHIRFPEQPVDLILDPDGDHMPASLVIAEHTPLPHNAGELSIPHEFDLPRSLFPTVKEGLHAILLNASSRWYLLVGAWALLVVPLLISAIRWRGLLHPQGIYLPLSKCLQLTFVGQFYSIMLPGVTGGDLVKIIYTARLTGSKTKSLITILLDRVIGLIALMTIAVISAGSQLLINRSHGAPLDSTLLNVFLLILALLVTLAVGALVYFSHRLRKLVGIDWFISTFASTTDPETAHHQHDKLEVLFRAFNLIVLILSIALGAGAAILRWETHFAWSQTHAIHLLVILVLMALTFLTAALSLVLHARLVDKLMPLIVKAVASIIRIDETLHTYRGHFGLLAWAFVISLPSQLTTPLSAWLAGLAFGIHLNVAYYLAYVPVAVLAASLPISPPQGLGILDGVILHFFASRATATASQALALAQSIRFLPILWNLVGGYWVITGRFSRHEAEVESQEMDQAPEVPAAAHNG
jgi:uncharacterized membrane protein YbhN (UPF0104 family)